MRRHLIIIFIAALVGFISYQSKPTKKFAKTIISSATKPKEFINKKGLTVKDRIIVPNGFKRVVCKEGSFSEYIRNYQLKPFGAKVINYDGSLYFNQLGHFGVLEIPVPENGLQQCADALIRIRSEYLWEQNRKNEIGFNFTSGHYCSWIKYAEGYRPKINGNQVTFNKTARKDNSKTNFIKYLNLIYTYSGTISLYAELPKVNSVKDLKVGDMLIIGGSPGHVVMIADIIENEIGERRFSLLQGNTPAQSVHLLKNLEDVAMSPWYNLALGAKIEIPGYTFESAKFVSFK